MTMDSLQRDKVTGFEGRVIACAYFRNGTNQSLLAPTIDDKGNYREPHWFDDDRLQAVSE